jgi:hypothetical protein
MDNFYMSSVTPLFFAECLADLEKQTKSTPEQLVGSLADRTPESQSYPNVHHANILKAELSRPFDLTTVYGRVAVGIRTPGLLAPSHVPSLEPHEIDDSYFSLYSIRSIQ